MKPNNTYSTIDLLTKLSASKQLTLKDLDQCLSTFEKSLSMRIPIEQSYPIFINLFINTQQHLTLRRQNIFKLFYSLIRLGDQNQQKILIFIHNIFQICEKRSQQIQQLKCLQSVLTLVKKAAQKQWGPQTATIFIKYYHQRLEEYLKGKPIQLQYLSQLSQILIPKYKHQYTQTIIKLVKSGNGSKIPLSKLFLTLQSKVNPSFMITILRQIQFKQQEQEEQIKNNKIYIKTWIQCFSKFIELSLYDDIKYLVQIFPYSVRDLSELLDKLLLITYLESKQTSTIIMNYESLIQYLNGLETQIMLKMGTLIYHYCLQSEQLIEFMYKKTQQTNYQSLFKYILQMIEYKKEILLLEESRIKSNILLYLNNQYQDISLSFLRRMSKQQLNETITILIQISKDQNSKTIIKKKQLFPTLSYQLFNLLSITPKSEIKHYNKLYLRQQSAIQLRCLKCLQILIEIYSYQTIIPLFKKCLQSLYDKVNQYTIRQNIHNAFLIKVKTICQNLLKNYDEKDLKWMFPKIPQEVIMEYVKYLSSKDKFRFRLEIYDKKICQFQDIINDNVSKYLF